MDFTIANLGTCKIKSPFFTVNYVNNNQQIVFNSLISEIEKEYKENKKIASFELAGARKMIYFDPSKTKAAIVTCGGLCPGLNDVIRAIVMQLYYQYSVKNIYGIMYGYQGLMPKYGHPIIELTPDKVVDIHLDGGSILHSSRGHQDVTEMVDALERMNINILFTIGGDGTLRAANLIVEEIKKRCMKIAIVGVPKTIDNDIMYIEKSFGFETAFAKACEVIRSAHTEAKDAPNGIGIVKLMGRHSGYITANAALGLPDVNFVLIPEIPFSLEGPNGLFEHLRKRLETRHHAVIVVAEGAGQDLFPETEEAYASWNKKLYGIVLYLKKVIKEYFAKINMQVNVKYIDPSYIIRSVPANAHDSLYCGVLGRNAVHAAMTGKTDLIIGSWNRYFTHVPIKAAISDRHRITETSYLWHSVIEATGQPISLISME